MKNDSTRNIETNKETAEEKIQMLNNSVAQLKNELEEARQEI
jgi:hypothetical protein